jgi:CubicO group peptidase (beta-lactamase class C family)
VHVHNWDYAIAHEIIEKLSGKSWGTFLEERIFKPLQMHRTNPRHDTDLDNVANAYMAFSNGSFHHLPRPFPGDGKSWNAQ